MTPTQATELALEVSAPIVTGYVTNLSNVADYLGISVVSYDFTPHGRYISGSHIRKERTILVNKNDPYIRQRYTVSHEIGRLLMFDYEPTEPLMKGFGKADQNADLFAKTLLVQPTIMEEVYYLGSIPWLADLFKVSNKLIADIIKERNLK